MSDQNTPRHPTVLAGHRDVAAAAEAIGEMRYGYPDFRVEIRPGGRALA